MHGGPHCPLTAVLTGSPRYDLTSHFLPLVKAPSQKLPLHIPGLCTERERETEGREGEKEREKKVQQVLGH